ncbi:Alpha-mannosyltransferase [Phaffia rhodozyma]|uniref:Alpha-mannosyltransferase n=1 Tax=Phaffia rhodozyma TaxID=264483 RepID=A0A0F7SRE0_PHARH|nr:Alpha-mannosyltransferase [Phaffia rhodozyma]
MLLRKTNVFVLVLTIVLTSLLTVYYLSSLPLPSSSLSEAGSATSNAAELEAEWEKSTSPPIIPPSIDLGTSQPEGGVGLPVDPKPSVDFEEVVKVTEGNGEVHILPVVEVDARPSGSSGSSSSSSSGSGLSSSSDDTSDSESSSTKTTTTTTSSKDRLARSLQAFLDRPVRSYAEALKENVKACPLKVHDRQVNPDQLKGERKHWKAIGTDDVVMRREQLVNGLNALESQGEKVTWVEDEGKGDGRGIVVAGGNRDTTARLLALLRILRNELHSNLPVQVFHFPGEITAQSERDEIEQLGGTLVQFEGVKRLNIWKNFQIKALSILKSTFSEVLYLDSDNIPLKDPAHLFESELYLSGGKAVFWPDITKDHPENAIFRILGETCDHKEWQIDSGQILIDKRGNNGLNLAALHLAGLMQKDHEFWFKLSGGDKDTFRYAFHMLDIPFAASPRWLSSAGNLNPAENNRFCGNTMLQYDLPPYTDTPLFLHANLLKHTAGVRQGSTFTHIKYINPSSSSSTSSTYKFGAGGLLTPQETSARSDELDGAKMYVYTGKRRGMCVDVEFEDFTDGGNQEGKVELVEWEKGNGLKGLEDMFYKYGGRAGGW